jgi:hypothetical protein
VHAYRHPYQCGGRVKNDIRAESFQFLSMGMRLRLRPILLLFDRSNKQFSALDDHALRRDRQQDYAQMLGMTAQASASDLERPGIEARRTNER